MEAEFDSPKTDPGVVFYFGKEIPNELNQFARKAIHRIVKKSDALTIIKKNRCEAIGYKSGRGLVGALAAIGENLFGDHTYELIVLINHRKFSVFNNVFCK